MGSLQEQSGSDLEYTPREHREKWHELGNHMQELKISIAEVKVLQGTTNGRVKELELSRARQEGFNKALAIFGAVAWALCFAFTSWVATQLIHYGQEVQILNTKLSQYEITVEK